MSLRLVHTILLLISVHSLLTDAHVLRANADVPKVVSGPGRIVSVSKPLTTGGIYDHPTSRDEENKEINNLLYAIYHKYYKDGQQPSPSQQQQQQQQKQQQERIAAQQKKSREEPTKRAVALKELENTIDKLIASLSDEKSASKLQTKDINKGINDISKLAGEANILPVKREGKDGITSSKDEFPHFKRTEQTDEKVTNSMDGQEKRTFHSDKRATEVENFADFKSRFYKTFLPEILKNDPGIAYPGDQKSNDQGILYHGDQKSKDPGLLYHGKDQGILFHGKDAKPKDQGLVYHGKDQGILFHGKDNKPKDQGILFHGKDNKPKDQGILFHGKDNKPKDQGILFHGKDNKPKDQGILFHGKDNKPKDQGILFHGKDTTKTSADNISGSQMNDLIRLYELLKKQTVEEEKVKRLASEQSKKTAKKTVETIAVLPDVRQHDSHMDTLKKDLALVFDDLKRANSMPPMKDAVAQHRDAVIQHDVGSQHDEVSQHDVASKQDTVTQHDAVVDEKETKRRLLTLMHSLEAQLTADDVTESNVANSKNRMEKELDNLTAGQQRTQLERENLFREALKGFQKVSDELHKH